MPGAAPGAPSRGTRCMVLGCLSSPGRSGGMFFGSDLVLIWFLPAAELRSGSRLGSQRGGCGRAGRGGGRIHRAGGAVRQQQMNRSERWRAASSAGDRRAPGPGGGAPKRGEAGRRWGEPSARRAQSPAGSPALGPAARRSHAGGRHAPDSAGEGGGGRLPPLRPPAPLQRPRTCPPPPPPPRCRHGAGGPHAGAAAAPSLARSLARSLLPSLRRARSRMRAPP